MMPPLSDQQDFTNALLNPQLATPTGLVNPDGSATQKRFNVYRNNVVVSLIEALGQAYPAIKNLTGEQFFDAMAREYVLKHPPQSPLMILYGAEFADFLADFPPVQSLPYASDVARLERAWREAYHAADAPPLDPSALGQLPPELLDGVRFILHPSLRWLSSAYAVVDIWHVGHGRKKGSEITLSQPHDALIVRPDLDVMVIEMPAGTHQVITALSQGATLAEAAEAATANSLDFGQVLGGLLPSGAVSALDIPGQSLI